MSQFVRRRAWCALVLTAVVAGLGATAPVAASTQPSTGSSGEITEASDAVPGQYIVTLRADKPVRRTAAQLANEHDGDVLDLYRYSLRGFSVEMSRADALALSEEPGVVAVEEDGQVHAVTTQTSPTWGLDRIDQRNLPLDSSFTYTETGAGVTAFIIDTGIRVTHTEFGGRASIGTDTVGGSGNDCNGHGTHVAGTVGGSTYGVAKSVSLVAVRVLNCAGSGSNAGVIAGVDWVTAHHSGPSVANMSLGGSVSTALDTAVRNSIASGVTYAVAAGNSNTNACNGSPARTAEALTVGATTSSDARSSFSNYGSCVDLFAPGSSITSAWRTSDTATNTISGTSMAAPHVAGVAAAYLQSHPTATAAQVATALVGNATPGKVTNPGTGSPNRLLYEGTDSAPPPPPPPANDAFANGQVISGASGSATGATGNATKEAGEPNHAGNAGGHSIWFRWTAPSDGSITVDTVGSNYDTLLAAYTGSAVNGLTVRASNDDITSGSNVQSRITFSVLAGTTYHVAVDGWNGASGNVTLNWTFTGTGPPPPGGPANDAFANGELLSGTSGSTAGTTVDATKETGEPNHAGNPGGHSVWYRWTAPASGLLTVNLAGSDFDTLLAVYTGTAVNALTSRAANDDFGGPQSRLSVKVTAGSTYRIAVDGKAGAQGAVALSWSLA
jgi:subtilisin family serine protease